MNRVVGPPLVQESYGFMICTSVDISPSGSRQLNGRGAIVAIPREIIIRTILSHASRSRHPFLRFLVGFVMIATGIVLGIVDLGGFYLVKMEAFTYGFPVAPLLIVFLIWVGGLLHTAVLRGRYNLQIHPGRACEGSFLRRLPITGCSGGFLCEPRTKWDIR